MPGIFSEYCGIDIGYWEGRGIPRHAIDRACLKHDKAYEAYKKKHGHYPYFQHIPADQEFLDTIAKIAPEDNKQAVLKAVAQAFFKGKRAIANGRGPADNAIKDSKRLRIEQDPKRQRPGQEALSNSHKRQRDDYITPDRPAKRLAETPGKKATPSLVRVLINRDRILKKERDGKRSIEPGATAMPDSGTQSNPSNNAGAKETPLDDPYVVYRGPPDYTFASLPFNMDRNLTFVSGYSSNDFAMRMTSPLNVFDNTDISGVDKNTGFIRQISVHKPPTSIVPTPISPPSNKACLNLSNKLPRLLTTWIPCNASQIKRIASLKRAPKNSKKVRIIIRISGTNIQTSSNMT